MTDTVAYDYILAGGGIAGLSLAYHLTRSPLRNRSILIVDRDAKDRDDRTLGFWADRPTLFDDIVYRSWSRLQFVGEHPRVVDLGPWRYKVVRGIDFYRFVKRELSAYPNVEFLQGTVDRIDDSDDCASVSVGGQAHVGSWVFDSRPELSQSELDSIHHHALGLHFKGWVIETGEKAFNPQIATPFDFRTPQKKEMRFFYVLPYSERQALVEYVLTSRDETDQAMKAYLEDVLGIHDYRILAEEGGVIPISAQPFPRRVGRHIMNIGTRGGMVKPSSGYAFTRIQKDSAAIVQSLLGVGHPFNVPPDSRRYRLYDSLLLRVMRSHGEQIKLIFNARVRNNPMDRVFRFLDGTASPREDLLIFTSIPSWPFFQAMFGCKAMRRV